MGWEGWWVTRVVVAEVVIRAGTGTAALVSTTGASLSTVIKTAAAVAQIADDPTKNELMGRRRRRGSRRKRAIIPSGVLRAKEVESLDDKIQVQPLDNGN
jgi:hypothetical protein